MAYLLQELVVVSAYLPLGQRKFSGQPLQVGVKVLTLRLPSSVNSLEELGTILDVLLDRGNSVGQQMRCVGVRFLEDQVLVDHKYFSE